MKQFLFISIIMMGLFCTSSCSQSSIDIDEQFMDVSVLNYSNTRTQEDNILIFESETDFQKVMEEISSFDSDEEKLQWVKTKFPEFSSIQTLYWEAMQEMAEINAEDKEVCERFQSKYSALYFPLYKEDGGFYIPMKNLDAAFLANENCEVIIGGLLKNLRDIWSYGTLMDLGRAYYSTSIPMTRASMGSFSLNKTDQNSVGPEYDSDWTIYGSKKVKLKARRVFKKYTVAPGFNGSESLLHLEFCFRKQTWFGWGNVKRESEINFSTTLPPNIPLTFNKKHNGNSSHDSEFRYPVKITSDATKVYYTFAEVVCHATVDFEGIDELLQYTWTMPGIQATSPSVNGPALIIPNY